MDPNYEYQEVETTEEYDFVPVFAYLNESKTNQDIEKTFKKLIIAFNEIDPIMNFNNYKIGPMINMTEELKNGNPHISRIDEMKYLVEKDKMTLKKCFCPICGNKPNNKTQFSISKFYETETKENPYFNQKKMGNSVFNYISCSTCLSNIRENLEKYGKPLRNKYLYDLYKRYANAIGIEEIVPLEHLKFRCLYPTDRIAFLYKNQILYFNLFNFVDYIVGKFDIFVKNNYKDIEDYEIEDYSEKLFSSISINLINENDERFQIYRDFEAWIKQEAEKDLLSKEFIYKQLKSIKYDTYIDDYMNEKYKLSCLMGCTGCSGDLEFENKNQIIETIAERKAIDSCNAKQYLIDQKKDIEETFDESIAENENEILVEDNNSTIQETETENNNEIQEDDSSFTKSIEDINNDLDEIFGTPPGRQKTDAEIIKENEEEKITKNDLPIIDEIQEDKIIKDAFKEIEGAVNSEMNEIFGKTDNTSVDKNEIFSDDNKSEDDVKINQSGEKSVEELIIYYNLPSSDDLNKVKNYLADLYNKPADSFPSEIYLTKYAHLKGEELFAICKVEGKEYLNKYPGINYNDLKNYIIDSRIAEDKIKFKVNKEKQDSHLNNIEPEVKTREKKVQGEEVEDPNMAYLNKVDEKAKKASMKTRQIGNYKAIFNVPALDDDEIPFAVERTVTDTYNKSPFRAVFDEVVNKPNYKAGNITVHINDRTGFIPIVDFPDVGVRFVCIETNNITRKAYKVNPVELALGVPFPNRDYKKSYSINVIYTNECIARPNVVANHIYKLVNARYIPKKRHVVLTNGKYPLAYTTEINALKEFEASDSIFTDSGRVKNEQVSIIAFVEKESNDAFNFARAQNTTKIMDLFNMNRYNSMSDLLNNYTMWYACSAHYTSVKAWNTFKDPTTGRETSQPYILYTITQYTENQNCIISDGLPAVVAAIIKEHDRKYASQGLQCAIVYEYDLTALVSPSVRALLSNSVGIFEVDQTSFGQPEDAYNTSFIIIENRFKQPPSEFRDDYARADYRWFTSSPETFRKFMGNKIRKDENIDNRYELLSALGYVDYKVPKTRNYAITNYAMKELEASPLYKYLFEINLSRIFQSNSSDAYREMVNSIYANKFMAQQNHENVEEISFVTKILDHAYRIFGAAKEISQHNK